MSANAVGRLIAEWQAARAALAELERSEHPDVTDRHGRIWTWRGGDLYTHDNTLAAPLDFVTSPTLGLPKPQCAENPNYARLCSVCRQDWPGYVQLELFQISWPDRLTRGSSVP